MTVDHVAFSGSIISVSSLNKELLIEVGPAEGPDIHQESIVKGKGTCVCVRACVAYKPAQ